MKSAARLNQNILLKLALGKNLTKKESLNFFSGLFQGELSPADAKSLLILLSKKIETSDEIAGCYEAIRRAEPPRNERISGLMDTCGTGGDNSHSFNISTAAALVIAGAGGRVAKHGNRAITSRSGSSDLMEALGVRLDSPPKRMIESIRRFGIGYFHAPFYHPVFLKIQPIRRKIKHRTIFNLLGPLLNPMRLSAQFLGVSRREDLKRYASVFQGARLHRVWIGHSRDGMDEVTTSAETEIIKVENGRMTSILIHPQSLGFKRAKKKDYAGGDVRENKKIALALLKNKLRGPLRDVVVLNAAVGLAASGLSKNLEQGIVQADRSLSDGNAYEALRGLVSESGKR